MSAKARPDPADAPVRLARPEDHAAILAFFERFSPDDPNRPDARLYEELLRLGYIHLVEAPGRREAADPGADRSADTGDAIIGLVLLRDRGIRPWTAIDFIAVDDALRGGGAAIRLLEAARLAAIRPVLRLFVRASNERGAKFFTRHGFRRSGTRSSNYADGEDALILMRWIGFRQFRRARKKRAAP